MIYNKSIVFSVCDYSLYLCWLGIIYPALSTVYFVFSSFVIDPQLFVTNKMTAVIQQHISDAKLSHQHAAEVSYILPYKDVGKFSGMLDFNNPLVYFAVIQFSIFIFLF